MMRKLIEYSHYPGGSCACVAWSGVFRKHGYNFSEADVFGLGSGIFFGFLAIGKEKLFDICLTSHSIVDDLIINTGIYGKLYQYSDGLKCLEEIIKTLDKGFPVAVQLNPLFCDGLVKVTPIDLQKYLPSHWVVIVGYDLNDKTLRYYDNRQFNPITITFDKFIRARNSGNINDQNPRNFYYNVYFYEELFPIEHSTKLSLRKAYLNFLDIDKIQSLYTGNYGLEKLIRQITLWNKLLKAEQLPNVLEKIKLSITGAAGIKGGYRLLFSKYLMSASKILENEELQFASTLFSESASYWNVLVEELTRCSLNPADKEFWGNNSCLSNILKEVKRCEFQGFSIIKRVIQ